MGVRKNKGAWTREEHEAFLRAVQLHGRSWEAMEALVPTRTALQIRTHAQKYFSKVGRGERFPEQPYVSQHDIEAGKSGVHAGAYAYGLVHQGQQHGQKLSHEVPGLQINMHQPLSTAAAEPTGSTNNAGASFAMPPAAASLPFSALGGGFRDGGSTRGSSGGSGRGGGSGGGSSRSSFTRTHPGATIGYGSGSGSGRADMASADSTCGAPSWRLGQSSHVPSLPAPTSAVVLMPPMASLSSSNICTASPTSGYAPPFRLADRPAASFGVVDPAFGVREEGDAPAAHGVGGGCGGDGGGGLQRSGGLSQEPHELSAPTLLNLPPVGVDRMHSGAQQRNYHQQLHQLQHLLLEDVALDDPDPGQGYDQPELEDFVFQGWTPALGDDGSLFETESGEVSKLGMM